MAQKTDAQKVGEFTAAWIVDNDREIKMDADANGALTGVTLSIKPPNGQVRKLVLRSPSGAMRVTIE